LAAERAGESFQGLVLRYRGRTGLTQQQLAAHIGVHTRSVQAWESGVSYPSAESLQALIGAYLEHGGFGAGREVAEAEQLWATARRESTRLRPPFDTAWFAELLDRRPKPKPSVEPPATVDAVAAPATPTTTGGRLQDWSDAPDPLNFLGRTDELAVLTRWVLHERCRMVALLGIGGIGKTRLAGRLARQLAPTFERVYWRSVRNAPTPGEWLSGVISFLSSQQLSPPAGEDAQPRLLLELLRERRCLLVLDNFEPLLESGAREGGYCDGYAGYGRLLEMIGQSEHQSCLLLTSREAPPELAQLGGASPSVHALEVGGLGVNEAQAMLSDKRLRGDEAGWANLVARYGGNGLALKVVGESIRQVFGGEIDAFLEQGGPGTVFGGIRRLLAGQLERLSPLEQDVLRWLAIERDAVTFGELAAELTSSAGRGAVLEALEALRRRSLVELSAPRAAFTLQSVVLEYVTGQLVQTISDEIESGHLAKLVSHALVKAQANDYVRRSQERLLVEPLLERLTGIFGTAHSLGQRLGALLADLRKRPQDEQGYAPGNLVNLLRVLRGGDLRGLDLSGLSIRQAFLQEVEAQDASLAGAHLAEAVLAQVFNPSTAVALSLDGTLLAAGTSTGEVYLWRATDRMLLATLRGHAGGVWGVAVSGDGRTIASSSEDRTVRLWSATDGRLITALTGHTSGVWGVALSGDGRVVASGSQDGAVKLWEASTGRLLADLDGHTSGVWGLALNGDGTLAASGGADGLVKLWEAPTGRLLATLEGHTGGVQSVALAHAGHRVASGSYDTTIRIWATPGGRLETTLRGHTGAIWGVGLSRDGQLVASGSFDGTVKLWETESGRLVTTLHGDPSGVRSVALSGDAGLVGSASFDGRIKLWETPGAQLLATLEGHTLGVQALALSADARLVASGGVDGTVKLWDTASGDLRADLHGHTGAVRGMAVGRDGRLVASASYDGTVRLWDAPGGRLHTILQGHTAAIWGVSLSEDGELVASGSFDGTVMLWEASTGRRLRTLVGHRGGVQGVALTADGRLLASGSFDGTVKVWDTAGGDLLTTLIGHQGAVRGVALSRDGRLVASGSFDGTVKVWDTASSQLLTTLVGHTGGVWGVALSGDGRLAASGSFDATVKVWDTASGRLARTFVGHEGLVYGVALSRDGQMLASGSVDGTVRLWAAATDGGYLRTLRRDRRYERLDISGLTGITAAQREALLSLGAIERRA
jgi:WD40 repeat protein/transcriptional regulator with XRE-family HTH domain